MPRLVPLSDFGREVEYFMTDTGYSLKEICAGSGANYYTAQDAKRNDNEGLKAQELIREFMRRKRAELDLTG